MKVATARRACRDSSEMRGAVCIDGSYRPDRPPTQGGGNLIYIELGKPVTPRADAREGFPDIPKCRLIGIGKKEPRGDLFEHLKRDKEQR